jgi:hypothetical protein
LHASLPSTAASNGPDPCRTADGRPNRKLPRWCSIRGRQVDLPVPGDGCRIRPMVDQGQPLQRLEEIESRKARRPGSARTLRELLRTPAVWRTAAGYADWPTPSGQSDRRAQILSGRQDTAKQVHKSSFTRPGENAQFSRGFCMKRLSRTCLEPFLAGVRGWGM